MVENLSKRREPLPALSGIYFITPTDDSVKRLIDDFKTRPLYKTAHVFFSSKVTRGQLNAITKCPGLTQRLRTCKEVRTRAHVCRLANAWQPVSFTCLLGSLHRWNTMLLVHKGISRVHEVLLAHTINRSCPSGALLAIRDPAVLVTVKACP